MASPEDGDEELEPLRSFGHNFCFLLAFAAAFVLDFAVAAAEAVDFEDGSCCRRAPVSLSSMSVIALGSSPLACNLLLLPSVARSRFGLDLPFRELESCNAGGPTDFAEVAGVAESRLRAAGDEEEGEAALEPTPAAAAILGTEIAAACLSVARRFFANGAAAAEEEDDDEEEDEEEDEDDEGADEEDNEDDEETEGWTPNCERFPCVKPVCARKT